MSDYLKHHGVKGQKWGVRKDVAKGVSNIANESSNIARTAGGMARSSKKVEKDMASMSDQELRAKINRLDMERRYSELNPSAAKRGADVAASILSIAGSVAAIGGSVATIALAISKAKKKG